MFCFHQIKIKSSFNYLSIHSRRMLYRRISLILFSSRLNRSNAPIRYLNQNIPTRPVKSPKPIPVKIEDRTVRHLERLSLVNVDCKTMRKRHSNVTINVDVHYWHLVVKFLIEMILNLYSTKVVVKIIEHKENLLEGKGGAF